MSLNKLPTGLDLERRFHSSRGLQALWLTMKRSLTNQTCLKIVHLSSQQQAFLRPTVSDPDQVSTRVHLRCHCRLLMGPIIRFRMLMCKRNCHHHRHLQTSNMYHRLVLRMHLLLMSTDIFRIISHLPTTSHRSQLSRRQTRAVLSLFPLGDLKHNLRVSR